MLTDPLLSGPALREILHEPLDPWGFTATGGVLLYAIGTLWNGISKTDWFYNVTLRTLVLLQQYLTRGDCPGVCWEPPATSPASTRSSRSPYIVPNTPPVPTPHSSATSRATTGRKGQKQPKNTTCEFCGNVLSSTSNLGKHVRGVHKKQWHKCPKAGCGKGYTRHDTMMRHVREKHNNVLDQ